MPGKEWRNQIEMSDGVDVAHGLLPSREVKILMRLPDGRNVATRQAVHGSAP